MNILDTLPKPFFILAPMDDVTDTVFRQIVGSCAAPDLYFTEFVNVDGLQSPGRQNLLKKLQMTPQEKPIIAQLWGKEPENFYKTAQELKGMGFDGVDLNMGCPVKTVIKNGACSALMNNRELAAEIIQAVREGDPSLPLSVKTRLGFNEVDLTWHELLLKQKLNMLSIHGRTKKQLSAVPADWAMIGEIRKLRDRLSPATLMVGNGDVESREQGERLAQQFGLDGIMIGRGIFRNPFVFAKQNPWPAYTPTQKIALYRQHVELFATTWNSDARHIQTLNKFCKVYIAEFDGAKELREALMQANSTEELLNCLDKASV